MQIEVSATRVIDKLAAKVGALSSEIAHLQATNEVLTERLREYVEREQRGQQPAAVDDQPEAG
jgi:hypothetical protein